MIGRVINNSKLIPLKSIYIFIIGCFVSTFVLGCFIFTIEADESWMLMSSMKAFGIKLVETSALDIPVVTSGGLHLVIHGLISLLNENILIHRFVSLFFAIILLILVFFIINFSLKDKIMAVAGSAAFAATPGFLLQSSMATAEVVATVVLIFAILFWLRFGAKSVYFAILGGILFGLACATRMTCLAMLPAILIWSFFSHRNLAARLLYPILAIAMAVIVFLGCVTAYFYVSGDSLLSNFYVGIGSASGLGNSYAGLLLRTNYLLVNEGVLPTLGIFGLVGWYVIRRKCTDDDKEIMHLCGFLLVSGIFAWAAWILKAPIAHIRYLWPAVPLLWLAAILIGLSSLKRVKNPIASLVVHATIMSVCLVQGLLNIRALAVGESLTVLYEFARKAPLATPRQYFSARNDQEAIIRAIKILPTSGQIYSISVAATYPITYSSRRTIKPLQTATDLSDGDFLILVPSDRNIWLPSWHIIRWIQDNALLLERHGDYALYTLRKDASMPSFESKRYDFGN